MQTLGKLSGGYSGGSPRVRSENSTFIPTPKVYGQTDIDEFLNLIKGLYYNNSITQLNIQFLINCFTDLKADLDYTNLTGSSDSMFKLVLSVEALLADGLIDNNYIQSLIDGLIEIPNTITPKQPEPLYEPKDTIIFYGYNEKSTKIRTEPIEFNSNKLLSETELVQFGDIMKDLYFDDKFTRDELLNFINCLIDLRDSSSISTTPLSGILKNNISYLKGAYADGRLTNDNISFIVNNLEILSNVEKPIKEVITIEPKNKITTIKGYNK